MHRDSFAFYLFHFIGLASVAVAIVMGYLASFKVNHYKTFEARAGGYFRDDARRTVPWYVPKRLWRISLLVFGFLGTCYILYGGTRQLTSWFPYSWRDEDGDWTAINTAITLGFFAACFAWSFMGRVQKLLKDGESAQWRSQYRELTNSYLLKLTQAKDEGSILRYRNMAYLMADHGGTQTQRQLATNITYGMEPYRGENRASLKDPTLKLEANILFRLIENQVQVNKLLNGDDLINALEDAANGVEPPRKVSSYNNEDPITDQIRLEELVFWANETDSLGAMKEFFETKAMWYPR